MLKALDILLGVSVVMLIVSMGVTMITQGVLHLWQSRGKKLLEGLADLLQQMEPEMRRGVAAGVANLLLRHPLVTDGGDRIGATLHREEFTTLLLELGAGNVPQELKGLATPEVTGAISGLLKRHGVDAPLDALKSARAVALELERVRPDLAASARRSAALVQEVGGSLMGEIHAWYDQTIDRVASRFTGDARVVTGVASVLVAVALQLDTITLMNRLSVDPALRQALVEVATTRGTESKPLSSMVALTGQSVGEIQNLVQIGAITLPGTDQWLKNWTNGRVNALGVGLSALLLSLGAPFWYSALKNLIRLRSVIAGKDDEQRTTRQTAQALPGMDAVE